MTLFDDARELIQRDSTTGKEESACAYLEERLRAMGLEVRSQVVTPERRNLMAGPSRPKVLFCTHTDTVPPYVPFREDETHIYGRGACDTKGIAAAMLEAGRRLLAEGCDDFGYLFVVGEEVDNCGARAANETVRADYLIVGEPTENRLAVGHKGFLALRIAVEGQAAHSAYPHLGDSALHRLLAGLERLRAADLGTHPVLGEASVNVGVVHGGVAANVLAPAAEAVVAVRVVEDMAQTENTVRACFHDPETGATDPRVSIEVRSRMCAPELTRVEGFPETVVAYGTDVPFLSDVGKPLLFGPGSIHDAHTDGEKIEKQAMADAVDHYVTLVRRLCQES